MKESWGNVRLVADFLCLALWHLEKMEMLVGDDDDLTNGDDVGPEESTTNIEWTVINPQI